MKLGYFTMNTDEGIPPADLGRYMEDKGYDSLWFGEHPQIPCSRKTPYPGGGELPGPYKRMLDPFVSFGFVAAATTELRLGTAVALPLEHNPFSLAKCVSTLDRLSQGRFLFGVGVGWNKEELANSNSVPWSQRYKALAESVDVLRVLWTDDEAEFHGTYYDFDPVWSYPKPIQQPHPPLVWGVAGKVGIAQAAKYADVWMPIDALLDDVASAVGQFRELVAEAGREEVPVTLLAMGNPSFEKLTEYRDIGVERVVIGLAHKGSGKAATMYPFLDHYASVIRDLA